MARFVFASESVTEGHPDKVSDRISDAILDAYLAKDPMARVACETLVATEFICVAGEITAAAGADVDHEAIARRAIRDIGYDTPESGIGWDTAQFMSRIVPQSTDIAQGTAARKDRKIGAGDQGLMFGYAQAATEDYPGGDFMPVPISLAHGLTRRLTELRRGKLPYLRPDGKSQVSVRFEDGRPVAVDVVVLAAQHKPEMSGRQEDLHRDLVEHCVRNVVPEEWLHDGTKYFINHTGKFETGGPRSDCGLTGRKIIVDSYGGWVPHGGGAFSGKDPTKVDRSAAYYARHAAKSLVAAGIAPRVQIQVAYSIGSLQPVSLLVDAGGAADAAAEAALAESFDFSPGAILEELRLRRPIYTPTTAYGHFGRQDVDLPWEKARPL